MAPDFASYLFYVAALGLLWLVGPLSFCWFLLACWVAWRLSLDLAKPARIRPWILAALLAAFVFCCLCLLI